MNEKITKKAKKDFHAVEFMRKVRGELTELYLRDKPKYLDSLKHAMEDFKARQKKTQA
jgi:hypothetical protein